MSVFSLKMGGSWKGWCSKGLTVFLTKTASGMAVESVQWTPGVPFWPLRNHLNCPIWVIINGWFLWGWCAIVALGDGFLSVSEWLIWQVDGSLEETVGIGVTMKTCPEPSIWDSAFGCVVAPATVAFASSLAWLVNRQTSIGGNCSGVVELVVEKKASPGNMPVVSIWAAGPGIKSLCRRHPCCAAACSQILILLSHVIHQFLDPILFHGRLGHPGSIWPNYPPLTAPQVPPAETGIQCQKTRHSSFSWNLDFFPLFIFKNTWCSWWLPKKGMSGTGETPLDKIKARASLKTFRIGDKPTKLKICAF